MGPVTAIDNALAANQIFVDSFQPSDMPPSPKLALVLCMDARIDPIRALGLPPGHAHIIRNAGGRVAEAIRSLIVSQTMIGTDEVAIVHHTQCGMAAFSEEAMQQRVREARKAPVDGLSFLAFSDLEQSVRDDIELYRQTPLLRQDIPVRGFIYEVETGRFREVV